jgi:hypothetical protein
MIQIATETVFPLSRTGEHVPLGRNGKKLHPATAFRWAQHGLRGVKLETIRVGGTTCTSVEALQRFFDHLSAPPAQAVAPRPSPAARSRAAEHADRKLIEMGVK